MISDFPRVISEIRRLFLAIGILLLATREGGAERINQEGRILPLLDLAAVQCTSSIGVDWIFEVAAADRVFD
jgi:hypothetical protein